jgi:hypothetical protein
MAASSIIKAMANIKWVKTKEEAIILANKLSQEYWGIEVNKTNSANKKYPPNTYFVRWGAKKKKANPSKDGWIKCSAIRVKNGKLQLKNPKGIFTSYMDDVYQALIGLGAKKADARDAVLRARSKGANDFEKLFREASKEFAPKRNPNRTRRRTRR